MEVRHQIIAYGDAHGIMTGVFYNEVEITRQNRTSARTHPSLTSVKKGGVSLPPSRTRPVCQHVGNWFVDIVIRRKLLLNEQKR